MLEDIQTQSSHSQQRSLCTVAANPQQPHDMLHLTSSECPLACGVSTESAYGRALSKNVWSVDLPVLTLMPHVKLRSGVGMFTPDPCWHKLPSIWSRKPDWRRRLCLPAAYVSTRRSPSHEWPQCVNSSFQISAGDIWCICTFQLAVDSSVGQTHHLGYEEYTHDCCSNAVYTSLAAKICWSAHAVQLFKPLLPDRLPVPGCKSQLCRRHHWGKPHYHWSVDCLHSESQHLTTEMPRIFTDDVEHFMDPRVSWMRTVCSDGSGDCMFQSVHVGWCRVALWQHGPKI